MKRELRVRFTKPDTDENGEDTRDLEIEGKVANICHAFTQGIKTAVIGVCVYVAMDTARQVIVGNSVPPTTKKK